MWLVNVSSYSGQKRNPCETGVSVSISNSKGYIRGLQNRRPRLVLVVHRPLIQLNLQRIARSRPIPDDNRHKFRCQPLVITLVFTGYFVLVSGSHVGHATEPIPLRVLSYNIHHGEGIDRKLDLERIAKVILSVKPDIVALQEVDKKVKRTGNVDQPSELARLTKMKVAFGANIKLQGGDYGNAVLCRFPIRKHTNHQLPNVDQGEQRGVLAAKIVHPQLDQPLLVLATHFDHRPKQEERVLSAKFMNTLVEKEDGPALLLGDLNDVVESDTLHELDTVWTRTNHKSLPTVPVKTPKRQIDFILYRPAKRWKVIETRVLKEAVASDHRAIFSILELTPGLN